MSNMAKYNKKTYMWYKNPLKAENSKLKSKL